MYRLLEQEHFTALLGGIEYLPLSTGKQKAPRGVSAEGVI
jgi:hypothetical protein